MAIKNQKALYCLCVLPILLIAVTSGQNKFEQNKLYKVCGIVHDTCLSAYDDVEAKDDAPLGQVTTQDYTADAKQAWLVRAPFDQTNTKKWSSFYPKDNTNSYNNVTLGYPRKYATPNLWRVLDTDTGNFFYSLRLERYSQKNDKDIVLGCLEHTGNGKNVWLSPCNAKDNQKWKFGLLE